MKLSVIVTALMTFSIVTHAGSIVQVNLDRGLIAIPSDQGGIYLSWRLLENDPPQTAFNLYRKSSSDSLIKLNEKPIRTTTDFHDSTAQLDQVNQWSLRPVLGDQEVQSQTAVTKREADPSVKPYIAINFQGDYICNRVALADLNGDGKLDYVIKQPDQITDPGVWRKSQETWKIEAYLNDGTFLWRKDLGWNIEQGIWWSPMIVYDFDGDGKAEVAVKSAPTDTDYRNDENHDFPGRVMTGPEYCEILDGMTGKKYDYVDWIARGKADDWGDAKNNRASRHLMGVAYLDGKHPSLLVLRGTYTLMRVDAYDFINKKLLPVWRWSGDTENPKVRGQGMHGMHAVDVDHDGKHEIILGATVLDDNGKILWNTGLGHPDGCYVTDIYPDRPGLEIMYGIEPRQKKNGICVADAQTGQILWGIDFPTTHVHGQGMFGNFDPDNPGLEYYSGEKDRTQCWTYGVNGKLLSTEYLGELSPKTFYWLDGDLKVYATRGKIQKYHGPQVGQYQGRIIAVADCLGDWREEIITTVPGQLRIYTTTTPAKDRRTCLMQDDIYRMDAAMVSMGYLYPPQLSYYLKQ